MSTSICSYCCCEQLAIPPESLQKVGHHQKKKSRTFNHSTPPGTCSSTSSVCAEMHWTDEYGIFKWEAMSTGQGCA